uniref:Secreted protein n=1 Tax=Pavo cristatus TaxID=9049 RepID=A0A8C9EV23_PAVCR
MECSSVICILSTVLSWAQSWVYKRFSQTFWLEVQPESGYSSAEGHIPQHLLCIPWEKVPCTGNKSHGKGRNSTGTCTVCLGNLPKLGGLPGENPLFLFTSSPANCR